MMLKRLNRIEKNLDVIGIGIRINSMTEVSDMFIRAEGT